MEDAHIAKPALLEAEQISLFGVFDGHGGNEVSKFCELHFPGEFARRVRLLKTLDLDPAALGQVL